MWGQSGRHFKMGGRHAVHMRTLHFWAICKWETWETRETSPLLHLYIGGGLTFCIFANRGERRERGRLYSVFLCFECQCLSCLSCLSLYFLITNSMYYRILTPIVVVGQNRETVSHLSLTCLPLWEDKKMKVFSHIGHSLAFNH